MNPNTEPDVFNLGQNVGSITIPRMGPQSFDIKKRWGLDAIRNFVMKNYELVEGLETVRSYSNNGSLTGTKLITVRDKKKYIFMLMEKRKSFGKEVFVFKLVQDVETGEIVEKKEHADDNAILREIPHEHQETLRLTAKSSINNENLEVIFPPFYPMSDPLNDGKASMRFYTPMIPRELLPEKTYDVRTRYYKKTGNTNIKMVDIIQVMVEMIE